MTCAERSPQPRRSRRVPQPYEMSLSVPPRVVRITLRRFPRSGSRRRPHALSRGSATLTKLLGDLETRCRDPSVASVRCQIPVTRVLGLGRGSWFGTMCLSGVFVDRRAVYYGLNGQGGTWVDGSALRITRRTHTVENHLRRDQSHVPVRVRVAERTSITEKGDASSALIPSAQCPNMKSNCAASVAPPPACRRYRRWRCDPPPR